MAGSPSDQVAYLHGDLDLRIICARNLYRMDTVSERLRRCVAACTTSPSSSHDDASAAVTSYPRHSPGHGARRRDQIVSSHLYVTVRVPQATVASTRIIHNSHNPKWDQRFLIALAHPVVDLEFHVKDSDVFSDRLIGVAKIPANDIASGEDITRSLPLTGTSVKPGAEIDIKLKFTPMEKNSLYQIGIAGDPCHQGVRNTYFPLRKGGFVSLYQDAHAIDGLLPRIKLDRDAGSVFQHEKCWEDICYAISEAHHLIYVVGWSVFHKIKLIRESSRSLPRVGHMTLGELLKYKSEEGVRVLLLVWDDQTSNDKYFINTEGLMQTHDEETRKFFTHSSVNCVVAPRYAGTKLGIIKQLIVGTMFTHHQKCVLVDTQASGNNRKITAFIGGIDLCEGRYDTPEHRLFCHLDTVSQDDFRNPTFPAGVKAPRQPWHDLHCRIEGPAAYDVLINFEQRWRKATRWKEFSFFFKGKTHWHDDSLIRIERVSWILSPKSSESNDGVLPFSEDDPDDHRITVVPKDTPALNVSKERDHNNWHVQIFRSIDSGSVRGFPTKKEAYPEYESLIAVKKLVIDRSIQTAYIQAIRSAQHFIYIENQYFLGSSYAWPSYKHAGADNLVPMELALKIATKIRAKERFAVYIVIPMWPEGDPKSAPVQEILFWQNQTMQMMYEVVAHELQRVELVDAHPEDYLNFYCLGKREKIPEQSEVGQPSPNNNRISEAYKHQRFMIYVHAKGMVVDDEYVLLGSANINQRSLAGTRDTEIAMGAYQPHHTWAAKKRHPRGQVYGYRMSLWAEHLGVVEECFDEPDCIECVKKVNEIAINNREGFKGTDLTPLQGHLLKYPIKVDADGKVGPLQGFDEFPDVGGKVIGSYSNTLPDILTT